jgi:integrative and conjugative element protein (TIGR02256 family)
MLGLRSRRINVTTTVWLPDWAREAMLDAAHGKRPAETGGVLLGYEAEDEDAIVVTQLVGPGPMARHLRTLFEPDGRWQEKEVARRYEESGRRLAYLGDWHSHPDGIAKPSRKDLRTARAIGSHDEARMPRPIMLIVASDREGWRPSVFRLAGKKLVSAKLRIF